MKKVLIFFIVFSLLTSTAYAQWGGSSAWGQIRDFLRKCTTSIIPSPDCTHDLGSALRKWRDLYLCGIMTPGVFGGDLIPLFDATYDIGESYTPRRWRELHISGITYQSDTVYGTDHILSGSITATGLYDADGDTSVRVESTPDRDIIDFYEGGEHLMEADGGSVFINPNRGDLDFIVGYRGTVYNAIWYNAGTQNLSFNANIVFNQQRQDVDFTIRKETVGDAYNYNAGTDIHTFGSDVFVNGVVTADGLTLDEDELISWEISGGLPDRTFHWDSVTHDFHFSDDINIYDVAPHLALIPEVGDAFEIYAYGDELYCTNLTTGEIIWRRRPDGSIDFDDNDITTTGIFSGSFGFTQGSIPFADATGALAEDNANLFWDIANESLGIGTATLYGTLGLGLTPAAGLTNIPTYSRLANQLIINHYQHNLDDFKRYSDIVSCGNDRQSAIRFLNQQANGSDPVEVMRIHFDGNIGIDIIAPPQALTIGNGGIFQVNSAGDDKNVQLYQNDTHTYMESNSGAIKLKAGNNIVNLGLANAVRVTIEDAGEAGTLGIYSDVNTDQLTFGTRDSVGNQFIFTYYDNLSIDHDRPLRDNPTIYLFADPSPGVSNNLWGSAHHDGDDFIFETGALTGAGTVPATVTNNLVFNPTGITTSSKVIRGTTSLWYNEYHLGASQTSPGASGATEVELNGIFSWNLDAITEYLYYAADIHDDWDAATDVEIEVTGYLGEAETADDLIRMSILCNYGTEHDNANTFKTQTLTVDHDIDALNAQFSVHTIPFTFNFDEGGNVLEVGDILHLRVYLDDVTTAPVVTDFNVTFVTIKYKSAMVRIEVD